MSDLTEFLLARIAEDEERATFVRNQIDGRFPEIEPWRLSWQDEYDLLCIEPSRVLAECEAKRLTLALLDEVNEQGIPRLTIYTRDLLPRLLALPYADHEDYRPEWRP